MNFFNYVHAGHFLHITRGISFSQISFTNAFSFLEKRTALYWSLSILQAMFNITFKSTLQKLHCSVQCITQYFIVVEWSLIGYSLSVIAVFSGGKSEFNAYSSTFINCWSWFEGPISTGNWVTACILNPADQFNRPFVFNCHFWWKVLLHLIAHWCKAVILDSWLMGRSNSFQLVQKLIHSVSLFWFTLHFFCQTGCNKNNWRWWQILLQSFLEVRSTIFFLF